MERGPDILNEDGTITAYFADEETGTHLNVQITYEGVIMDAYEINADGNDRLVGTIGRMANEWWEYITGVIPGDKSWFTDHLSISPHPINGKAATQDGE